MFWHFTYRRILRTLIIVMVVSSKYCHPIILVIVTQSSISIYKLYEVFHLLTLHLLYKDSIKMRRTSHIKLSQSDHWIVEFKNLLCMHFWIRNNANQNFAIRIHTSLGSIVTVQIPWCVKCLYEALNLRGSCVLRMALLCVCSVWKWSQSSYKIRLQSLVILEAIPK